MHREYRPQDMDPLATDPFAMAGPGEQDDGAAPAHGLHGPARPLDRSRCPARLARPSGMAADGRVAVADRGGSGCGLHRLRALEALVTAGSAPISRWRRRAWRRSSWGSRSSRPRSSSSPWSGEVLEAVTFARTKRALGRLVDQTPRTARVRRDGDGGRDSRARRGDRRSRDRPAGRADPGRRAGRVGPVDGRSVGVDRRVDPGGQGAGRSGLHRHAQPVRRDRGSGREGRPRDDVRPGASPGRAGPARARPTWSGRPTAWRGTSCRPSRSPPG